MTDVQLHLSLTLPVDTVEQVWAGQPFDEETIDRIVSYVHLELMRAAPKPPAHRETVQAHWTWRRTNQDRDCAICGHTISKGDRYARCDTTFDGKWQGTDCFHIDCSPRAEGDTDD